MSRRILFWLSSSRTLDTKVTKSRKMMKKKSRETKKKTNKKQDVTWLNY